MSTIVLVGAGNMGFAMLAGWMKAPAHRFVVVEPAAPLRERAAALGAEVLEGPATLPAEVDLIILAVKPQLIEEVAPLYRDLPGAVMSVAAGVTRARLEALLGTRAIVRVMPNTPAAVGQGMSVACGPEDAGLRALVDDLLSVTGAHAWLEDEALMDAVTAISGSGPAYVFHFIEGLAEAGEALGLPSDLALTLARETVAGAGVLARSSGEAPGSLREKVTSPGGTTAAALRVLRDDGRLGALLKEATTAARDRAREL